jgi:hypothetical protein
VPDFESQGHAEMGRASPLHLQGASNTKPLQPLHQREESFMKRDVRKQVSGWGCAMLALALGASPLFAAAKGQSFTGEVSDSMCGAKHMMDGSAECTRACVQKGSKYALIVGDKVYTLEADKPNQDKLDKLAGQKATVTGKADGDNISVNAVMAGK